LHPDRIISGIWHW